MNVNEKDIELQDELREIVEKMAERKMESPKDFDILSNIIFERTHEQLSSFTLKRFWGYIDRPGVRISTLNILCRFIGYSNWEAFSNRNKEGECESDFVYGTHVITKELSIGDCLVITWLPNRRIKVRFEGMDLFTIVEVENSRLNAGDTFHCNLFVEGEALLLTCLVQKDSAPTNYVCGKKNGIHFTVIPKGRG